MSDLSVVILCGRSPRHLYVANQLCRAGRPLAIVQEVGSELNTGKLLRLLLQPTNLWRKIWRWLRDRRRYLGNGEAGFFFGTQPPRLERGDLAIEVPHINHPDVVDLIGKLQPDIIAVFGTSLIKGKLLEMGKLGIINLHGGLSPHYRGADCTFWALFNEEPDQVGCTLHYIDAGIDTGQLIAYVSPEINDADDELTLFWRAVSDSAEVYAELLDRLEDGEKFGQTQAETGKLYQVKDRGLRHERQLEKKLASGMLRGLDIPRRIRWFPHPPERGGTDSSHHFP